MAREVLLVTHCLRHHCRDSPVFSGTTLLSSLALLGTGYKEVTISHSLPHHGLGLLKSRDPLFSHATGLRAWHVMLFSSLFTATSAYSNLFVARGFVAAMVHNNVKEKVLVAHQRGSSFMVSRPLCASK